MTVNIKKVGNIIKVSSPYSPNFINFAHDKKAKWDRENKTWNFNEVFEEDIKQAIYDVYGIINEDVELVAIDINLDMLNWEEENSPLMIGKCKVLERPTRDSKVRLINGTKIICGGFESTGGSNKYPTIRGVEGTVVRAFVPRYELDSFKKEWIEEVK